MEISSNLVAFPKNTNFTTLYLASLYYLDTQDDNWDANAQGHEDSSSCVIKWENASQFPTIHPCVDNGHKMTKIVVLQNGPLYVDKYKRILEII